MRILVAGMLARHPHQGGATWAVLQWALGLGDLGHEVSVIEQLPAPATAEQLAYRDTVARQTGVRAVLFCGPSDGDLRTEARADLLINLSGVLRDEAVMSVVPHRLYVDLDPGFTQVWHEQGADVGLAGHTAHATVGLNLGGADCLVPLADLSWATTLPPVVLARWSPGSAVTTEGATGIGHWRSYGSPVAAGVTYGQRAHSMRRLFDLPSRTSVDLRFALGISPEETDDLRELSRHGWTLLDPRSVAGTPASYRRFVRGSLAELAVAKSGYVDSNSGWFSDRSACYLAAGRPVVAQDTGWSSHLPAGAGLHSFADAEGAAAALDAVMSDYPGHSAAAHQLARDHLDARLVLPRLLEQVL